jgi:hypothetical protein
MMTMAKTKGQVASTTQEILKRRRQAEAQEQADRLYYAETVQKLALGQADETDRQVVELLAEEFGFDLAADLDKLRKMADWAQAGFAEVGTDRFNEQLAELQHQQASAQVDLEEARQQQQKAEAACYAAQIAASKYESRGREIVRFREVMPHVFAVGEVG